MKKYAFNTMLVRRTLSAILLLLMIGHLLSSFTLRRMADDIWKQLGVSSTQGTESIRESFINGYLQHYNARNLGKIAVGDRAAITADLMNYTKKYVSSTEFRSAYESVRLASKPIEPDQKVARSKEEIRKEKIAEFEAALKKMEDNMKNLTPDMQKALKPTLELYRQQIKEYKDPNNKMIAMLESAEKMNIEQEKQHYQERYKQWELEYPVDVKEIIKKRLTYYVSLAATVDFDASLVQKNSKQYFANPEYERKHPDWKTIFRAGKVVDNVARPFAQQWLNELK